MKALWLALAAGLIVAVPVRGDAQVAPVSPPTALEVPDQILIRFVDDISVADADTRAAQLGARVIRKLDLVPGLYLMQLPAGMSTADARAAFAQVNGIRYAEPNYLLYATNTPNDPSYNFLWGLNNTGQTGGTSDADIDAPEAWNITTGSSSVVVVVIDTGIDYTHDDLSANMYQNIADCNSNGVDDDGNGYIDDCYGINTIDTAVRPGDPKDDHYHGTHVAGTIGAVGNNGIGVVGVNWNVKMIACKFLNSSGNGSTADAIECLTYVKTMKDRGVNIVATNNSWGGDAYSQALYDAIDVQRQNGILFIAAAGNNALDSDAVANYPSGYDLPNIISVAATTHTDSVASFSNYGRHTVDIAAPGVNIYSTRPANTYGYLNGTSMATPHVTGVAALLKAQDSSRDWRAIKNLILAGGDSVLSLSSNTVTGRRLNANGSLNCSGVVVQSRLAPETTTVNATPGQAITLRELHVNCASPNGDVTVTVSGGNPSIVLKDDGVPPDQAAGDGIYSGTFTPTSGSYTLTFPGGDTVVVDIANSSWDSAFGVPRCTESAAFCNSGTLLKGRDNIAGGAEAHQPNTINSSCADGTSGTYQTDESIESIKVTTQDGSVISPDKTLRVEITVYAFDTNDHLDIYTAPPFSSAPSWGFLATLTPARQGLQTLSTTFGVSQVGSNAIRANFRYLGSASSCSSGSFDDHDDLIYRVGSVFTDDPLTSGSTFVKTIHITELRSRIDAVRATRGLPAYSYTDPTLTAGSTIIKAQHITELRTALSQAYSAAGRTPPTYTDPGLGSGYSIKAVHITELRDAVIALE